MKNDIDIKSKTINYAPKTNGKGIKDYNNKNIKNISNKQADKENIKPKESSDFSKKEAIEEQTINSGTVLSSSAGYIGYRKSKKINSIPSKVFHQKQVKPAQNEYRQLKKDIKSKNSQHKQNISKAKKQYKTIKSEYKNQNKNIKSGTNINTVTKQQVNTAKNDYTATKRAEKQNIRNNKKQLKLNWKKLSKAVRKEKALRVLGSILAAICCLTIIVLIVSLLLSPLGILFSEDSERDGLYSLYSAMETINKEFSEKIKKIEKENKSDNKVLSNYGCGKKVANWSDIIAVWDVMLNIKEDENIIEIDESKFQKMREVVWDMVSISSKIEKKTIEETTTHNNSATIIDNPSNQESTTAVTKTITTLKINVTYKSVDDMCDKYSFSQDQKDVIYFLLSSDDYISLFYDSNFDTTVDLKDFDFGGEEVNDLQKKIVSVAVNASKYGISAKSGYCQAWVADIYQKVTGKRGHASSAINAGNMWSVSKDWTKIQVGATVYGYASNPYGHVGIYIGNGQVIHNLSGCVKIQSLQSWINSFNGVCWGWENGINLSGDPQFDSIGGLI